MRLWIFCVLAFCAGCSLAQRGIHEYNDEMYEEPFSTQDEDEGKVDMELIDNVDKDGEKSKEDLENAETGHDTISDYQFEDNRSSESNDKQNIVEESSEPINSPASDIQSEDNNDDEEDSENDGSETNSIFYELYKMDPPANGKNIEDNDNGYDGNPENYISEAENINENAKETADFQADSEDIEENDTEIRGSQKHYNSDAREIFEQQTEPMNLPAPDIERKDSGDGAEDSENDGFETDDIVEESNDLDPPADGKDDEIEDNGDDGNPENYSSVAENVSENAKEPADFRPDSEDIEEEDIEYTENLKSHYSDASKIVEQPTELMNSRASDIESEENDDDDDGDDDDDDDDNDDDDDGDNDEDSENYSFEADDIVEVSNELVDSSGDSENITGKYSGYEENLENDDSKVNSKEEEPEDGQEENQENDGFESDDIVEDPLIQVNLRDDDEDVEYNTSGYEENVDYNIETSVDKPNKTVDSSNDGDDLKYKDTDNEENQDKYHSEAYGNVEEPTEVGESLPNNENREDSDAPVNKVNSKMFEGYNYNDFGTFKEDYNKTVDSAIDQNRNNDEDSDFRPLTDTAISDESNGTEFNYGNVTTLPSTVNTTTEENEDTEPSSTQHSYYLDDIQNMIYPIPPKVPRADYYSGESQPFSSSGMGQNIVPEPLEATGSSNDELSDDLSYNRTYLALLTVFEALTDDTPHWIQSPDPHWIQSPDSPYYPPILEYYINAQGKGIELNITCFSVNEDSSTYLLVKPGGMYASDDDAIVLSYQLRQERMYRFKDADRLYIKYYSDSEPSPSNLYRLSVRMLNGPDPWSYSYYEQASLSVALGGSTPTAFDADDEKKEVFRRITTRMAEQYIADGHITWDNNNRELWTNISEVTSCTNDLWEEPNCVKVTFAIVDRNYPYSSFTLNDLMRMWYTYREEYESRLETMGLKLNWGAEVVVAKQKQHRLMVWLVIGAGALISAAMLVVTLWRFGCFKGYSRMPAHDDTESLTKKQHFPTLYSEQRLTWEDDKATKVDLDGYVNICFAEKLLDMDVEDDVKTTPNDRKTISPSDVYQV